jgi:arsenical pump membrane protein
VLPISNPANLVVYGKQLPPLFPWLKVFLLPSLASIVVTFVVLRLISRRDLDGKTEDGSEVRTLTPEGRRAAWGMAFAGVVLISASVLGMDLGIPTLAAGARQDITEVIKTFSEYPPLAQLPTHFGAQLNGFRRTMATLAGVVGGRGWHSAPG